MNKIIFPVEKMCKVLEVSRNSYYNWTKDRQRVKKERRALILELIIKIYNRSGQTYGSPRITQYLQDMGYSVSEPYIAKIMKENGIRSILKKKFVVTTDSEHDHPISDNILDRDFNAEYLGQKWVSDITYIKVKNNWNYLTTIIDLADRKVIGWHISNNMTTRDTIIPAWFKARANRRIHPKGLIFHSDRGVQYASNEFRDIIKGNKLITQSMSRKGNCWDNAVAESFFKTYKYEKANRYNFTSTDHLIRTTFVYIEGWYNTHRIHSSIGNMSPRNKEIELLNILLNAA